MRVSTVVVLTYILCMGVVFISWYYRDNWAKQAFATAFGSACVATTIGFCASFLTNTDGKAILLVSTKPTGVLELTSIVVLGTNRFAVIREVSMHDFLRYYRNQWDGEPALYNMAGVEVVEGTNTTNRFFLLDKTPAKARLIPVLIEKNQ